MVKFIIDANLPLLFSLWNNKKFIHVYELNDEMSDEEIWNYAKERELTIVTKDADFSLKVLYYGAPPRVIHLRIGNMKMDSLHSFLQKNWNEIENISKSHRLTNVYDDRIEGVE